MHMHVQRRKIVFDQPLEVGRIVRRPNRFIIDVDLDGSVVACHCPTTGRIGNLVLNDLPCLLSRADPASKRVTTHTVEAISVDPPRWCRPAWIGINQNAANRFVELALTHDLLPDLIHADTVQREQQLGPSRLDFLVNGNIYIEVKTPLDHLQVIPAPHVATRTIKLLDATGRMVKHIGSLADSLTANQRAVMLMCFLYDNPGFQVTRSAHHDEVRRHVNDALRRGVELWQTNFRLTPTHATVSTHHPISLTD